MDKDLEEFTEDLMLLINAFITDTTELKEVLVRVESQLESLEEDVSYINKVVRDGNGRQPLMTRIELIEQKLDDQEKQREKWWKVWVAAVPGLLALITTGTFIL
jgi:hypothetical protein